MPRSRQRIEPHVSLIGNQPTEYSRDGPAVVATPALRHDDENSDRMDQLHHAV